MQSNARYVNVWGRKSRCAILMGEGGLENHRAVRGCRLWGVVGVCIGYVHKPPQIRTSDNASIDPKPWFFHPTRSGFLKRSRKDYNSTRGRKEIACNVAKTRCGRVLRKQVLPRAARKHPFARRKGFAEG